MIYNLPTAHRREIIGGMVPVLLWLCWFGGREPSLWGAVWGLFLWVTAVFDFHYGLIFDKYLLPMAGIALLRAFLGTEGPGLSFAVGTALVSGGLFQILRSLTGGLGGGDVKLAAVMGLWLGHPYTLLALLLAFWSAGLWALFHYFCRRRLSATLPFGPHLALGGWLSYLYGREILSWYGALPL